VPILEFSSIIIYLIDITVIYNVQPVFDPRRDPKRQT
jgi:hypothetical protein